MYRQASEEHRHGGETLSRCLFVQSTELANLQTATAFWSVLLVPQYPIIGDVIEFINVRMVTIAATIHG